MINHHKFKRSEKIFLIFITLLLGSLNTGYRSLALEIIHTPAPALAVNRRLLNDGLPPPSAARRVDGINF